MTKKTAVKYRYRSAISGRFVTAKEARRMPSFVVREKIKRG